MRFLCFWSASRRLRAPTEGAPLHASETGEGSGKIGGGSAHWVAIFARRGWASQNLKRSPWKAVRATSKLCCAFAEAPYRSRWHAPAAVPRTSSASGHFHSRAFAEVATRTTCPYAEASKNIAARAYAR